MKIYRTRLYGKSVTEEEIAKEIFRLLLVDSDRRQDPLSEYKTYPEHWNALRNLDSQG